MFDLVAPTLALDCSLKKISLGLFKDNNLLASYNALPPESQSQDLIQIISDLLKQSEMTLAQIKNVIFSEGPGSFTSLRVGLATLQGLFWQQNIQFATCSALLLRCLSVKDSKAKTIVSAVSLGRKKMVVGSLQWDEMQQPIFAEKTIRPDDHQSLIERLPAPVILAEDDSINLMAFKVLVSKNAYNIKCLNESRLHYMAEPDLG